MSRKNHARPDTSAAPAKEGSSDPRRTRESDKEKSKHKEMKKQRDLKD